MKYLKNNHGASYVTIMVIILAMGMVFSVVMEYLRISNHLNQIRKGAEAALVSLATDNWDETYKSVREGYAGAWRKDSTNTWKEVFEREKATEELGEVLGLNAEFEKEGAEGEYYKIQEFDVEQVNSSFQNKSEVVIIKAKVVVEVPFRTIFKGVPPLTLTLKVQSRYQGKF